MTNKLAFRLRRNFTGHIPKNEFGAYGFSLLQSINLSSLEVYRIMAVVL